MANAVPVYTAQGQAKANLFISRRIGAAHAWRTGWVFCANYKNISCYWCYWLSSLKSYFWVEHVHCAKRITSFRSKWTCHRLKITSKDMRSWQFRIQFHSGLLRCTLFVGTDNKFIRKKYTEGGHFSNVSSLSTVPFHLGTLWRFCWQCWAYFSFRLKSFIQLLNADDNIHNSACLIL